LWSEIKEDYETAEIVSTQDSGGGIGIVHL